MKNYFAVFSPKIEDYQEVEDIVYRHVRGYTKKLLVKELGRNETHPHLNFVFEAPFKMKSGRRNYMEHRNIYRKLVNIFPTELLQRNSKLVCLRACHDTSRLINGYLKKEQNAQLLINEGFKYIPNKDPILVKEVKRLNKELRELIQSIKEESIEQPFDLNEHISHIVRG